MFVYRAHNMKNAITREFYCTFIRNQGHTIFNCSICNHKMMRYSRVVVPWMNNIRPNGDKKDGTFLLAIE